MEGRRMSSVALGAIALIAAGRWQHVHKGLPAGVTQCRRVVAPHFDFRLATMRARHVIRKGSLQLRRHHYAKFNRHVRGDV